MYIDDKPMWVDTELSSEYHVIDEKKIPPGCSYLQLPKVERREWGAHNSKGRHMMRHPAKIAVDHFTYTDRCRTKEHCMMEVLKMQEDHMAQGLTDIKYNFLIGDDGNIYEGRGFFIAPSRSLVTLYKLLRKRLDIAFIGDFTDGLPELMWRKRLELLHYCTRMNVIKTHFNYLSIRRGDWLSTVDEQRRAEIRRKKAALNNTPENVDSPGAGGVNLKTILKDENSGDKT